MSDEWYEAMDAWAGVVLAETEGIEEERLSDLLAAITGLLARAALREIEPPSFSEIAAYVDWLVPAPSNAEVEDALVWLEGHGLIRRVPRHGVYLPTFPEDFYSQEEMNRDG